MSKELKNLYVFILKFKYTVKSCINYNSGGLDWTYILFNSKENGPHETRVALFENDFYKKFILSDEWTK